MCVCVCVNVCVPILVRPFFLSVKKITIKEKKKKTLFEFLGSQIYFAAISTTAKILVFIFFLYFPKKNYKTVKKHD
jgi:hypothetical protein